MVMDLIEAFESDLRNKSHSLRCGVRTKPLTRRTLTFELSRRRRLAGGGRLDEWLGRRFVLRPTALIIGRQAVPKVLPCFLLDR
jgi:hypothetical protein